MQLSQVADEPEQCFDFANRAVELANTLNQRALADAQLNLAQLYSNAYDDVNALNTFHLASKTAKQANYVDGQFSALDGLMRSFFYLDSFEKADEYAQILLYQADTNNNLRYKSSALLQLARVQQSLGNVDTALALADSALNIRLQIGNKLDIAQTYKFLGQIYYYDSRFEQAVDCYNREIEIKESINYDPQFLAMAYQNLGNTHFAIGNYRLALEKIQKALTLFEQVQHHEGIAICCTGIGDVYQNLSQSETATKQNQANYHKALEYYGRALDLFTSLESVENQGVVLQSIGTVYSRLGTNGFVEQFGEDWEDSLATIPKDSIESRFVVALDYYDKALKIFESNKNFDRVVRHIINANSNMGSICNWCRNLSKARKYINRAISLANKFDMPLEKSSALYALGENLIKSGRLDEAQNTFEQCAALSKKLTLKETLRFCYLRLSQIAELAGNQSDALLYFKNATQIKDEIFTEKSQRSINEMQTKYETDKKEQENKLLRSAKVLSDALIQRQRFTIIAASLVAVLIFIVALLMFKMFRDKQKANLILEEKNELILAQTQQITDSILYARSIQKAVLPSEALCDSLLGAGNYFVLFLPKDIVSGDFYWTTSIGDKLLLVAADCTGHGIPGAFISMLGISFLNEIVNKNRVQQPAEILNCLRNMVKDTLDRYGTLGEHKDGMDMSLFVYDPQNLVMEWAGAYNPLYLVRNGELTEYRADKMPVAVHHNDHLSFTNHIIKVQPGDTFYMTSDGFADQFNGETGKKFLAKRFRNLLLQINDLPMAERLQTLEREHIEWKGNSEQIDDILVVGFRV